LLIVNCLQISQGLAISSYTTVAIGNDIVSLGIGITTCRGFSGKLASLQACNYPERPIIPMQPDLI